MSGRALPIAVDGRFLTAGRGVTRYTRSLLNALVEEHPREDWRVFVPGREPVDSPVSPIRHRLGSRALFGAAAAFGRPRLDRLAGGAAVVWAPAPAPLAVTPGVPLVLTVHDLSWEARPQDFTAYERAWHRAARPRRLAERAARVIAVSEATREELLERWQLAPERVVVVRSGPGIGAGEQDPARSGTPPYFLAVGALEPRKAPDLLVRAHARARTLGLRAELWFAGAGRVPIDADGVRRLGTQHDAGLRQLYRGALALVQPAWLEGFAFPPVEALLHGTPAIVADLPVYAETVGGGALRVPPGDEEALALALLRMEREPALRAQLAAAGAQAVAVLSWSRAARETHAVLTEAAENA